jgi:hypothetical protein
MRAQPRVQFETEVELDLGRTRLVGRTADIGQGGAFVVVNPVPPVGTSVDLLVRLPGVPDVCRIPSIVRWTRADGGVGLQFERLRPIEVWAINRIVRSTAISA